MKKILVLCLMVCFSVAGISGVASAATKAGDSTVIGSLSYDATTFDGESGGVDLSTFSAAFGVGKFFTDNFEVELALVGQTMTFDGEGGSETLQQMGLQLRPNWHFNTAGKTVPYIGLTVGYLWADLFGESTGAFLYGGQAGIKQFIKENSYIQYEVGYTASTVEFYGEDTDVGDLRLSVGFGWKF